jgi:predicted amidophosphoribosyltransferase
MILRTAIDSLAAVPFPAPCRICGATLLTASRTPTCAPCLASFEPIRQPMWVRCGRPFPIAPAGEAAPPTCRLRQDNYYAFDFARSYGVYNDALHHAILLLKYEEVTRLGDWFAARLVELVAREPEQFGADVVVPVPPHPDRQRERAPIKPS